MHLQKLLFCLAAVTRALAYKPCPLLGPVFEPPENLSTASPFQKALNGLKTTLDNATKTGTTPYGSWPVVNNSFSLGIFDATTPTQLFSYQFTSKQIQDSKQGVTAVSENSIYRIGSLSKLITAYLFLIEVGPTYWSHPITEFVPALAATAEQCSASQDPVDCIDWNDVTLGALASHMAGLPRDYSTPIELLSPLDGGEAAAIEAGFPPLPKNDTPPCGLGGTDPCPKDEYLAGLTKEHPVFAPFTSPIYSNAGYELLEFALEKITGKSIPDMLEQDIFGKLNMSRSSYYTPTSLKDAVIPGDIVSSEFGAILGNETPVGGYYSTQSDLARLGQSILASTLLKPAITRQWMKPVTFTSAINQGVGMPWEIWRAPDLTDHVLDLYTKAGDLGSYSSYIALSPDYNVGFVVLVAGSDTTQVAEIISDIVASAIFPALENTARQQSQAKFAGTYNSTDGGKSKIVLATQPGMPGLKVEQWINNGTSIDLLLASTFGDTSDFDIRLYPSITGSNALAYRAVFEPLDTKPDGGVFSPDCTTWVPPGLVYGNIGVDEILFQVEDGKVTGLSPRAFRTTLKKTG